MDGNRRWARLRGISPNAGYEAGAKTLRDRVRDARELGVRQLTVYSLSTENMTRPPAELKALTSVLARRITSETRNLLREGVRIRFIGNHSQMPRELLQSMRQAHDLTASNDEMTLFLAIHYGARREIIDAATRYEGGGEAAFQRLLCAPDMNDPQLIIRTGGEQRLSNFLLWQAAHSELVFRDELWPDFTSQTLEACLAEFRRRSQHPVAH